MCGCNCPYGTFPECRRARGDAPCYLEDDACAAAADFRRAGGYRTTEHYCPDCDSRGERAFLKTDGVMFRCPECLGAYRGEELADAYREELAGLEQDVLYVRAALEALMQPAA